MRTEIAQVLDLRTLPSASPRPSIENWLSAQLESGLISVVIPTWNRGDLIIESLESVKAQTYRPIEILVIDDGSTDNTASTVCQWWNSRAEEGIRLIYDRQPHRGAPAARNRGLQISTGEFIQFLDSDDLVHPSKFEVQWRALDEGAYDFVWSGTGSFERVVRFDVEPFSGRPCQSLVSEFIWAPVWITSSGLYRRSLCLALGPWDESLPLWQDWEYNLRIACRQSRIRYAPGVLSLHRTHSKGRINDSGKTPIGIAWQFRIGKRFEEMVDQRGVREVDLAFRHLFRSIALRAIECDVPQVATAALKTAMSRGSSLRQSRVALELLLYKCAGQRLARRILHMA